MDHQTDDHYDSWLDGAPTWVRVVQAVLIGLVAGLALHALLSLVVLQGSECDRAEGVPQEHRPPRRRSSSRRRPARGRQSDLFGRQPLNQERRRRSGGQEIRSVPERPPDLLTSC